MVAQIPGSRQIRGLPVFRPAVSSDFGGVVDDLIDGIIKSISKIQGKKGKVYNLASGNSISVKDLAELMISISKKDLDLNYTKPRDGDLLHSEASIQLAKDELEFQPETSLEKGLSNLINE